jgi:PAS domain S-box-containing protein
MIKVTRSGLQSYGVAVLVVTTALLLTLRFQSFLSPTVFLLFYPAVIGSTLYGGLKPGLLSCILSLLVCHYFLIAPVRSWIIPDLGTGIRLAVFMFVMVVSSVMASALVTARRRTETTLLKLQASEERYRILAENVPQFVWITRPDGFVEYFNQRWLDYTGLKQEQTLGWQWRQVIHPDDLPPTLEQWTTSVETGNLYEIHYRLKRADGQYRWHIGRALPLRNREGEIISWFGTCTDIHSQKQAEEALQKREQERIQLLEELEAKQKLLEAVLQQMPAGLIVAEAPSGQVVLMNEQVQQILRGSLSFVRGIEDYLRYQIFYPDGQLYTPEETPMARSLKTGEVIREEEIDVICGDGTRGTVLVNSTPIRNDAGDIVAAVATLYDITERKQSRERIQLYADIVKNVQVGIVAWQLENLTEPNSFRLITANSAAHHYTDVDFEALIGTSMAESFPNLMESPLIDDYLEVVRTEKPKDLGEVPYGDERIIKGIYALKAFPLPNHSLGLAFENVTKRKKVEEALRNAHQRLNFHVENTPLAVIERDREFRIKRWSQGAQRIFGWQAAEVMGKGLHELDFVFVEDIEAVNHLRTRLIEGVETHNFSRNRSYRKDGSVVYCEWYNSALLDASGNLISVLSLVLDVTEREQAIEALKESEKRFRIAQELSLDAFTILRSIRDTTGKIIDFEWEYVNPKAAELIQSTPEQLQGQRLLQILPGNKTNSELFERYVAVVETGIPHDIEISYHSEGIDGWFRNMAVQLNDGIAISFSDITKRKQTEAERIHLLARERTAREQAEAANRIKDEFLAVLSHELRSPLNPILGWTKLLQSRNFDAASTARALEIIERNAKLQIQLIEDLLDVSRILRGKLSLNCIPVDLISTLEAALETVRLAALAKSIEIQTIYEPNLGQVLGDSGRLQQVIWNLLSNAVKFTPEGGRIEVRLQRVEFESENTKTCLIAKPGRPFAQLTVTDTGIGINPDFLPYVFEYFRQENSTTTRKFGGLGLGLAIVHYLVEQHSGCVRADSRGEGQGATFTVLLPLITNPSLPRPSQPISHPFPDLRGIQVLVVDDEEDMREFLAFVLEESGADVTVVSSANAVLEALPRLQPNVLICDIGMPEMDGYMLIRKIRAMSSESKSQIPAIALTAYASEADREQALSAGFTQHVAKPVEPNELVTVVASLSRK